MRTIYAPLALAAATLVGCSDLTDPNSETAPMQDARVPGVAADYDVVLLGGDLVSANAINNRNEVAGITRDAAGDLRAFRWHNGTVEELQGLGGSFSGANDINNRGWIVGEAETPSGDVHAVLWRNGEPVDLGTLGGSFSRARAVNARGTIVGEAAKETGEIVPFIWSRGKMEELPVPAGTIVAFSGGLNNQGEVVGWASGAFPSGVIVALLWPKRGDVVVLDSPCLESVASDINERGQVVGAALVCPISTEVVPVIWEDLEFSYLEPVGGLQEPVEGLEGVQNNGSASAVNARGQIVGRSDPTESVLEGGLTATLWYRDAVVDLAPGFPAPTVGASAADINEKGVAVGSVAGDPALFVPSSVPDLPLHLRTQPGTRQDQPGLLSESELVGSLSEREWAKQLCAAKKTVQLQGPVTATTIMAGCF